MNSTYRVFFLLMLGIFVSGTRADASAELFCFEDDTGPVSFFYCRDEAHDSFAKYPIEPIYAATFIDHVQKKGVEIVTAEEFMKRTDGKIWQVFGEAAGAISEKMGCPVIDEQYNTYFRTNEFNQLAQDDPVILHLRVLAQALHDAGVCEMKVRRETYNSIDVRTKDDLIQQFLCISNSESLFGQQNIGMGGRGPWGIHPGHTQRKGTYSTISGSRKKLKANGLCYPSKATARDESGNELKVNKLYFNKEIILDNAKCAMKLYNQEGSLGGLSSWGKGKAWGSNRHCSKNTRDRLNFTKYLGKLACCSSECKDAVTGGKTL